MKSIDLPLTERVPAYHYDCDQSRVILEELTDASLAAREAIYDFVAQFWVASATWGLGLWEELVGIKTDRSLDLAARRRAVVTKLCGSGTCNADMVAQIARQLTGCAAEVVEHPAEYTFSLRFVGEKAGVIAVDKQEIIDTVEAIKPAHLKFIIEAIKWSNLEDQRMTWNQVEALFPTWNNFDNQFFIHQK